MLVKVVSKDERKRAVGKRIREARKALRLDRTAFGERVGVHDGSVARWESGGSVPTPFYLDKIAEVTGATVSWLRYGEGLPPALVIKERTATYTASPTEGKPDRVDQLFELLAHPDMLRRMSGRLTNRDAAAAMMQTAIDDGFTVAEIDRVYERARQLIAEDEKDSS